MTKKSSSRSKTAKLKIERQEILKQVKTKSYEVVRLSRVKYIGNRYNFIDVRVFQRNMSDDRNVVYHPTQKGVQLREDLFRKLIGDESLDALMANVADETSYEM
jgi:hypothetical protein